MTKTNLSQMPMATTRQQSAFREAALRRERELLSRVSELDELLTAAIDFLSIEQRAELFAAQLRGNAKGEE